MENSFLMPNFEDEDEEFSQSFKPAAVEVQEVVKVKPSVDTSTDNSMMPDFDDGDILENQVDDSVSIEEPVVEEVITEENTIEEAKESLKNTTAITSAINDRVEELYQIDKKRLDETVFSDENMEQYSVAIQEEITS